MIAYIIAVDPGTGKCGMAVLEGDGGRVLERAVAGREEALGLLGEWLRRYPGARVVVGDGTGSKAFVDDLKRAGLAGAGVELVDERLSSVEARRRYFAENPPRGWRRLLPWTLQSPPVPIDDYVAVILGERFLRRG